VVCEKTLLSGAGAGRPSSTTKHVILRNCLFAGVSVPKNSTRAGSSKPGCCWELSKKAYAAGEKFLEKTLPEEDCPFSTRRDRMERV